MHGLWYQATSVARPQVALNKVKTYEKDVELL